jgi:hypothetical protein
MGDVWKIEPEDGLIAPNSKLMVTVQVTLQEAGDRTGIVRILLNGGNIFLDVKVKVKGVGCNLGVCPPLDRTGKFDFGSMFM